MLRLVLPLNGVPDSIAAAQAPRPLYGAAATRRLEQKFAAALPPHTLMDRAGTAVARLARAWQPHARRIHVLAGGGNNGGDGLLAAARLRQAGFGERIEVRWLGQEERLPADARWALAQARAAGVAFVEEAPQDAPDLVIDALLGAGLHRPLEGEMLAALRWLQTCPSPTLCVDLPSGLDADLGHWWADAPVQPAGPRITLALLTLKPGLFTGAGRAAAGEAIWCDDLDVDVCAALPDAWLVGPDGWPHRDRLRADHASHKGRRGDVLIIGGVPAAAHHGIGMTGAALLAGRAALRAGAGRVWVAVPAPPSSTPAFDPAQPALMWRTVEAALAEGLPQRATVVAGCGAGSALVPVLGALMQQTPRLVLDADALNALGAAAVPGSNSPWLAALRDRAARGWITVLTPHPLEAARLLDAQVADVQRARLQAAEQLAQRTEAIVVLKGSGTVVTMPGALPRIVASGSGWLATAGSGDVLAGLLGARLAAWTPVEDMSALLDAVAATAALHGTLPAASSSPIWAPTAADLAP
ncbi:Bifunctional NAD(P)H-hydrate repair enzyme Nnr [Tepidimonas alkaliphilus]|uniref:ADP-dependent (S)-NAD(P)H-hydrate dehydratase n=1 Tax=Tepidimonas alkaliphilus TaxID=2588942 RepID=A0A554WA93_9BURK|nr:NAD(P)H-hydrate dehydratase [Tepidimonas alkaliphilus]TSE20484.1 Bifunctional NAD(P)H-hydrate repair enzyme Nnr [Tepidimonas alkaliphilus]